jgi:hypothetical protein
MLTIIALTIMKSISLPMNQDQPMTILVTELYPNRIISKIIVHSPSQNKEGNTNKKITKTI